MSNYKNKILQFDNISTKINELKLQKNKIVFTNGCFDILHLGHIDYLQKAKQLGDILIVGINSDSSVKSLGKNTSRPIQNQDSRVAIIASLFFVDYVVIFNQSTPYELIKLIVPDVLVKGADYKIEDIVGYDIVIENDGEVKTIEYLPGYSTTAIENKILESR